MDVFDGFVMPLLDSWYDLAVHSYADPDMPVRGGSRGFMEHSRKMCRYSPHYRSFSGFTLLELLIAIGIMSVLMALLLPALGRARDRGRLLSCLANLRSQGQMLQAYTSEYEGSLPPRAITNYGTGFRMLINGTLAAYAGDPLPDLNSSSPIIQGMWRCPDAPGEMWTHAGSLFHAPNTWLFNQWTSYDGETYEQTADSPSGWEAQFGTDAWRKIDKVREPSNIIAFIDNIDFFLPAHSHREAYAAIGYSRHVVLNPPDENAYLLKRGSHERIFKRNAVFVDGHAETLPWTPEYWFDSTNLYLPSGIDFIPVGQPLFYHREIERFIWMIGGAN